MLNENVNPSVVELPPAQLRDAWAALKQAEPNLRARDLAEKLGVSEGEVVASRCGEGVVRLEGPWADLIRDLPSVGYVMVLTRNDSCVHEKKGSFNNVDLGPMMGVVLDEAIDLRIFLKHWKYGFAVREESRGRVLNSLQFFDSDGTAVHKIYQTEQTDAEAWSRLVAKFNAAVQTPLFEARTVADPLPEVLKDNAIDVAALQDGWRAMRDPHDFFALLRRQQVTRAQALRLVGDEFAHRVDNSAVRVMLEQASVSELPIMVFVGSPGVVQIHTGPVHHIKPMGPWLNILDPDFNLHLREDHIVQSWVVRKPSPEGAVTSLELYDAKGQQIVQFFGKRKPGIPEREDWRVLVASLPRAEVDHG
ncbi:MULTISPECIES: hemin-degrading factor [Dyella]|uniref:Hemin-degrading factor n=2 Tax=Dyella TaxID=231454 RepID=A0A4R0YIJ3_9GAMM|nr:MULTISPECIES: ChuX/HutX family heme-like substrate-binding protein [Dyella]TBR36649.1 hemin-degrading factor [Dyella terrae]TCI08260.1 hemin-degrading factor [Dyella soli]